MLFSEFFEEEIFENDLEMQALARPEDSARTDEKSTLKVCKHCGNAFIAGRPNSVFCSDRCKNQYNVYKSRTKDKDNGN